MRWIVRFLSLLLMLVLVVVGALALIPSQKVAEVAAAEFQKATGRVLSIGGGVRPMVWPVVGVTAREVTVSNISASREGPMFNAAEVEIGLDTAALIGGEVRITSLIAVAPEIVLERAADGTGNWEFGATGGSGAAATPGAGRPFSLARGQIRDGRLILVDHATGTRTEWGAIDAEAAVPAFDGPAEVKATATLRGQDLRLDLTVANFADLLAGRVVGTQAALVAGDARIAFDGRAGGAPLSGEGALDADLGDLGAIARLAGIPQPDLPAGLGAGSVTLAGKATLTAQGSVHLRGGTLVLDGQALTVDADLVPGAVRPNLSAVVTAGTLDLSGTGAGAGAGGGGSDGADAGWSTAPIDAGGLGALDASISLRAEAVALGPVRLEGLRTTLTIERARAVLDVRQATAFGGSITGEVVANARDGFSARANLVLADLEMQPLLAALAGYDRLSGRGTLRFNLLSSGASVDALMRALSGEGSLALASGALRGLDIAGMVRTLDPGHVGEGESTIFDRVTGSFRIDGGVLENTDLALAAPLLTAQGAGKVDLGRRTLDYRLRPTAMAEADGSGGVMVPILVTGPWAAPKIRLDLQALADEKLAEERAALEARARDEAARLEAEAKARLEQKAREELGLTVEEGETPEAALERRAREVLEDEATRALERLLGGD